MINPFKFHYVCDDLQCLENTEQAKTEIPKNKWKMLWMIFRGEAIWQETGIINHAFPIAIHLLVSVLIWWVFGHNSATLLAALYFLIHPLNTEVSIWLSAKHYGIMTALVLIAWAFPVLSLAFPFIPMLFFNINGLFSPVMFLWRGGWWGIFSLVTLGLLYRRFGQIFSIKDNGKLQAYSKNEYAMHLGLFKIIIALKFYGYYLANSIFALHYSFYQGYMNDFLDTKEGIERGKSLDRYFFIGVSGIFILVTNLIWNYNPAVFGLLWATVNFAMWTNAVNVGQQYVSNRQGYLANVGICLMLGYALVGHLWIAGILGGWYLARLAPSILQFKNVYWHFFYQIADEPDFYYSWINMGNLNFHRGHFSAAISDYQQALSLSPKNFKAFFNLSSAWFARGRVDKAIFFLEQARRCDIYAQEDRGEDVVRKRMELINRFVEAKGNLKLEIVDIMVVS
jgi:tetratricopeptide (TPR) repeat protein